MPAPTTMEQIVHVLIRDDVPKVNYNYTHEEPGDPNMRFGVKNVMVIVTYANLIWISLLGNGVVFWKLYGRKNRSRVHFMLLHLCVADILVTVIEMPLQIAWKTTVQWRAGDTACRFLAGLRVVGLYLNAFLLIAISVDRFMSVWDPLSTARKATIRAKAMVFLSWILSVVCASPQLSVWSLKTHPIHSWYQQCVTFDAFQTRTAELAYGLLITILMYGLPLVTIIVCYLGIWLRISQYSRQSRQQTDNPVPTHNCNAGSSERLSCTTPVSQDLTRDRNSADFKQILINPHGDFLSKAKSRTLRMTALVVLIFIACWSPYQIIHIWFFVARDSAAEINPLLQEILFIFGVFSCVVDPYVYGLYSMGIWKEIKTWQKLRCAGQDARWNRKSAKRASFCAHQPKDLFLRESSLGPFQLKAGNTIFHFQKAYRHYNSPMSRCAATC